MILECENLVIGYPRGFQNEKQISFKLEESQVLSIVGHNGSGKTTLLKTILKEIRPLRGKIKHAHSLKSFSYLPQARIDQELPYKNLELLNLFNVPDDLKSKLASHILEQKWSNSSGGQKQLVLTLIKLAQTKEVLILDEPFNHLDKASIETMEKLLEDSILEKRVKAMIIVSHKDVLLNRVQVKTLELT